MLSDELKAAGFKIADTNINTSVFQHPTFGMIDFTKLTVEAATNLVKSGYKGLILGTPAIEIKGATDILVAPSQKKR